ncbi:hypothetical protein ACIBSS_27900 [Micromonospora aurantiaca]|uniref:hypothetical protein n=1 Tax=Micromonospora aurantiaca (nom. illeg.) TaxID=47850 RepID=UPI000DFAB3B1|nr:hypothetical protein [Micromonospora provocatoris]RBJ11059.1 hypothetical protein DRA43_01480 [Micromonospora provocatoris]
MQRPTQDFADRPPWTRPGFIASAALVLAVIIAAIIVAVSSLRNDGTGAPGAPAASPTPTGSSTPVALPTTVPSTAPAGVRWELVGQNAVPVSESAGPSRISDGTAAGYAHTPEGALIAAAQLSTRAGYSAGRQSWEPTIQQQFEPGADRDRLLAALRGAGDAPAGPGELSQIAGYQYQSYTPDTAVIGLVFRAPAAGTPRYHVLSLTLRWREGDWRMVAPPGGAWTSVNRQTTDLVGVVEWGAR